MPTYPSLATVLPTFYQEDEKEYPGIVTRYLDGGIDARTYADTPIRRWTIAYENLTTAEAAQFDTLAIDSKYNPREGSLLTLTFTPRGEPSTTVRIDAGGFRHTRTKAWIHRVEMKLIKTI
jgi:hypothetical protein